MRKPKMVHIFDDEKFVDGAINQFQQDSRFDHEYVILIDPNVKVKYVTHTDVKHIEIDRKAFINKVHDYVLAESFDVIAFHALNQPKWRILNAIDDSLICLWFLFGYDLYDQWKAIQQNLYERETRKYVNRSKSKNRLFIERLLRRHLVYKWLAKTSYDSLRNKAGRLNAIIRANHPRGFYKAVSKIDFVAPIVKSEMTLLRRINSDLTYIPFSYDTIENFSIGFKSQSLQKERNILVGNSATPTNNHVDVFKKLSTYDLGEKKVIVPLSYGNDDYRTYILEKGKSILGDNFYPILNFMPLKAYNEILQTCDIAIFNHRRQQAVGNIIVMLNAGVKVFMNNKSPVYKEFIGEGVRILDMHTLSESELNQSLNTEEQKNNSSKMFKLYGSTEVEKKFNQLIDKVFKAVLESKYNA